MRREAASASELADAMRGFAGYCVPSIDWDRTNGRVMTIEWIDGVKISEREALIAAGHDMPELARRLVTAFLQQAISAGFFHADMHQGNLFVRADGTIVAIDFGIMGRIDRRARQWLAEILYGLITGNYRRVAEIHFEAQYVPSYHSVDEFATALRAVGEPMRGKPVSELSVGQMLDGLFAITRDFDMQTQPHLLLLQKTMVMVEGIATSLDPAINMWDVSAPFVREWIRDELGPEAALADRLRTDVRDAAAPARARSPHRGPLPCARRRARTAAAAGHPADVGAHARTAALAGVSPRCAGGRRRGCGCCRVGCVLDRAGEAERGWRRATATLREPRQSSGTRTADTSPSTARLTKRPSSAIPKIAAGTSSKSPFRFHAPQIIAPPPTKNSAGKSARRTASPPAPSGIRWKLATVLAGVDEEARAHDQEEQAFDEDQCGQDQAHVGFPLDCPGGLVTATEPWR